MARRRHAPEQVINKLREAEVAIVDGSTVAEAARRIGVTGRTFYRWRSEYGGLRIDQPRHQRLPGPEGARSNGKAPDKHVPARIDLVFALRF